jgi:hypothetical protein
MLNYTQCYEDVEGCGGTTPQIIIRGINRSEWSASCPGHTREWNYGRPFSTLITTLITETSPCFGATDFFYKD